MHINIIFHLTSLFLHLRSFFSDPDLKIEVDLAREEEEKNGRREYRIYHLQYRYAGKYVG